MQKFLIVIADKGELSLVDKAIEEGLIKEEPILITGIGAINIIESLKGVSKDIHIINIGYAGSDTLKKGKFYKVKECGTFHDGIEFNESRYHLLRRGPFDSEGKGEKCWSGSTFVTRKPKEDKYKNSLFDMELAYICALGFENVTSYKWVSDNLNKDEYDEVAHG